jgi:esterase FrsA
MTAATLPQKLFVTACAATRTTNLATRWTGAAPFLPKLFVLRYANMGGLDHTEFARQIRRARSFRDNRWCAHWDRIADQHARRATDLLRELAGKSTAVTSDLADPAAEEITILASLIAPAATLFADHGPQPGQRFITTLVDRYAKPADSVRITLAFRAIDAWVKAITYYQISAFPGHSTQRMQAYRRSRKLFDTLITAIAPAIDITAEHIEISVPGGDVVRGWLVLPSGPGPHPVALITNGLEGTVQELAVGQLRYRASGLAVFMMEMPGSYSYTNPMGAASETIYHHVIDHLSADRRLDPDRIAMVGVSFGGYWAARMAAADDRLACAIACGAPTDHSFSGGSLGTPEIIISALSDTLGATSPLHLLRTLKALSIRDRYAHITIPLLAINGDHDTLMATQDTIDLAGAAPRGELLLYPDDDHCAMRHYRDWLDHSQNWLIAHLTAAT